MNVPGNQLTDFAPNRVIGLKAGFTFAGEQFEAVRVRHDPGAVWPAGKPGGGEPKFVAIKLNQVIGAPGKFAPGAPPATVSLAELSQPPPLGPYFIVGGGQERDGVAQAAEARG